VRGEHLGVVVGAAKRLDPFRRGEMLVHAGGAGDLAVGDVAHEQVAERVLGLALDRRAAGALDELLALEPEQRFFRRPTLDAADRPHGADPKDLADNRGVL
jgi:hypothetical protein